MTQTRDKLTRERISDQQIAIKTHEKVGKEVRDAIARIGGTPPEKLPPAEHIKLIEKRIKKASPKLELEEKDAKGLIGPSEEE
jgi:DNA-damage-inducible protein D